MTHPVPTDRALAAAGRRRRAAVAIVTTLLAGLALPALTAGSAGAADGDGPEVRIAVGGGLLDAPTDGRVVLIFAPAGSDPLQSTEVDGPNASYGMNVSGVESGDTITLAGGSLDNVDTGVFGYPHVSLDDLPAGDYRVQAFLTRYETVERSDGSTVSVRFPCGDGAPKVDGPGSLRTSVVDVTVGAADQVIDLSFSDVSPPAAVTGTEIGGCAQGNYADTATLKHVKIRSEALSAFWGRDMYVAANVALPAGYDPDDPTTRYPVVYTQSHWPGGTSSFGYPDWTDFAGVWDSGTIPASPGQAARPTPRMILVTIRHESPFYDDSYGVNSANLGPWGDAINDELVPFIDRSFHTIAAPYGRIQEGGSTGGWISVANTVLRPDLYGAAFSYYPDSLDFHQHQDIGLYTSANAYTRPDGSKVGSIRDFPGGNENILVTVEQENRWELVFGTSSRSSLQWDVWNTVFGVQGLNGYPLEPWDKVTGEIFPGSAALWKPMDMSDYVAQNWSGPRGLGAALKGRLHISVGAQDNYFLDGGVVEFQRRVEALGGPDWAEISVQPGLGHGGFYQNLDIWTYLDRVRAWVDEHAPTGATPLSAEATAASTRGNVFSEVIAAGGHRAALDRQSAPVVTRTDSAASASTGTWDPGVDLVARWIVDGQPLGDPVEVAQGTTLEQRFDPSARDREIRVEVTGTKTGYRTETRASNAVVLPAASTPGGSASPGPGAGPGAGAAGPPAGTSGRAGGLANTGADDTWALSLGIGAIAVALGVAGGLLRRRASRR